MVEIEDVAAEPSPSEERLLDAEEIEKVAATIARPSAKIHLEALAKKLRKESAALKRVEQSRAKVEGTTAGDSNPSASTKVEKASAPSAAAATASAPPPPVMPSAKYVPVDKFAFDAGGYDSAFITLYIDLPAVGSIAKDQISCNFTPTSFDLVVTDLRGKSYRLFKDNLEKDIDPEKSKYIVKRDKIVIKLAKIKTEYGGYDFWSALTAKKKAKVGVDGKRQKDDPAAGIMDLMKEMYDSGDDNMRKVIGETMLKQRTGQLDKDSMLNKGAAGLGDFGDEDF